MALRILIVGFTNCFQSQQPEIDNAETESNVFS